MTERSEKFPIEIIHQNYICCVYDNQALIWLAKDLLKEHSDFFIKFMHPYRPSKIFSWPSTDDICWVCEADILCIIDTPSLGSCVCAVIRKGNTMTG